MVRPEFKLVGLNLSIAELQSATQLTFIANGIIISFNCQCQEGRKPSELWQKSESENRRAYEKKKNRKTFNSFPFLFIFGRDPTHIVYIAEWRFKHFFFHCRLLGRRASFHVGEAAPRLLEAHLHKLLALRQRPRRRQPGQSGQLWHQQQCNCL